MLWFVAPPPERMRREIGAVGLDQYALQGHPRGNFGQGSIGAIGQRPSKRERKAVKAQTIFGQLPIPRKTVKDTAQPSPMLAQQRHQIGVRIAVMQNNGQTAFAGQGKLLFKRAKLLLAGRKHAVIVKASFANRYNAGPPGQLTQFGQRFLGRGGSVMRVNANSSKNPPRMLRSQINSSAAGGKITPRVHQHADPCLEGCGKHGFAVRGELARIDMRVAINEQSIVSFRSKETWGKF